MNLVKAYSKYRDAVIAMALISAALLGYIGGANASWFFNAIYVAHATGRPALAVIDPLHRAWIKTTIEASTVPPVIEDDEELARNTEAERG
jgi:hypothetical protein